MKATGYYNKFGVSDDRMVNEERIIWQYFGRKRPQSECTEGIQQIFASPQPASRKVL